MSGLFVMRIELNYPVAHSSYPLSWPTENMDLKLEKISFTRARKNCQTPNASSRASENDFHVVSPLRKRDKSFGNCSFLSLN